jgi:outer membrane protein assembly factor BamD
MAAYERHQAGYYMNLRSLLDLNKIRNASAFFLLLMGVFFCGSLNCSGTQGGGREISYRETARSNYDKGMAALKDENFIEANKYFTFVKNKFPFSRYATMAELRLADTYYAEQKFLEAVDAYRLFIKFHPTHPEVTKGYAAYRICQAYVEQIPSDWFLVPPSYEKDQGATHDALRETTTFLQTYPRSPYFSQVQVLHRQLVRRLADHELYVARFYLDRDKPNGAILRMETLLKKYPDAGVDPEVMFILGQTYLKMKQREKAQNTFASLVKKYPNNLYSAKAKLYLKFMSGERE